MGEGLKNRAPPSNSVIEHHLLCHYLGVTTVRLDLGKKYDTKLRTEFLEKVRYGYTVLYFPYRTVLQ